MAPGGPWAGPGRSGRSGDDQEAREAARKVKRGVSRNQPGSAITRVRRKLYCEDRVLLHSKKILGWVILTLNFGTSALVSTTKY